jgi:hypothetical protein
MGDISGLSLHEKITYERVPFGKEMLKQFPFGPDFKNLNHGMGAIFYNSNLPSMPTAPHNC